MTDFLISKIKQYVEVDDADIDLINELFVKEKYPENTIVLSQGSVCNKLWFISRGLLRFSINVDGDERTFVFRNEGSFTSDIDSLLKKTPSTKSIITIEESELYSITYEKLQLLYKKMKNGERFGRLLVEETFIGAVNHIVSFYSEPPEKRYIKLLDQNKDFIQRIPQYHIASFLGIKPQSLCRIKKRIYKTN